MEKEERSSVITRKLVLAFACMALLAFSLPSSLIKMDASGQNSTSSDQSANNTSTSSSEEQSADNSSSSSNSTNNNDTSTQNGEEQESQNATASSESVNNNSTDTSTQNEQSSEAAGHQSSSGNANVTSSNATSTATSSNSTNIESEQQSSTQNVTSTEIVSNITSTLIPMQNTTSLVTISGEQFVLADSKITRSFSYPLLEFNGEIAAELTVTLTWDTDGTTKVKDNRGYSYTISIPESQGAFSLWYNSTHVDQRVVGPELQYDVYWTAVEGGNGYVDRYKYTIAGTSINGSIISFVVDGGKYDKIDDDRLFVGQPASVDIDASTLDPALDWTPKGVRNDQTSATNEGRNDKEGGLELDWSDAIASGHNMVFDQSNSTLRIPVDKWFIIDPTVVATTAHCPHPRIRLLRVKEG